MSEEGQTYKVLGLRDEMTNDERSALRARMNAREHGRGVSMFVQNGWIMAERR